MTTQDKIFEVKRLMEEIITDTEAKSTELITISDSKGNLNALARMLKTNLTDYKTFLYNHWGNGYDKLLLRLDQYDNKESLK